MQFVYFFLNELKIFNFRSVNLQLPIYMHRELLWIKKNDNCNHLKQIVNKKHNESVCRDLTVITS